MKSFFETLRYTKVITAVTVLVLALITVVGRPTPASASPLPCGFSVDTTDWAFWVNCSTSSQRVVIDIIAWPDDEVCIEKDWAALLGQYSSWRPGKVRGARVVAQGCLA